MEPNIVKIGNYWINLNTLCWAEVLRDNRGPSLKLVYGDLSGNHLQVALQGEEAQRMMKFLDSKINVVV